MRRRGCEEHGRILPDPVYGRVVAVFGLVHGAWHGAWSWELLVPELESRGHSALAVDLPCDDPAAGASRYAEIVAAALRGADDLVLVGHSLGGLTAPLVADRLPTRKLVYLCAFVPEPGRSFRDQLGEDEVFVPGFADSTVQDDFQRSFWPDPEAAIRDLYPDLPRARAEAYVARLRPQARAPIRETCPLERLPDVPAAYVVCSEDGAIRPEWSRRVARERLGIEAVELPGGHSPMLSRPDELADLLAALT